MLTSSLLLTYSFNIQALSATTANNIQGTAPFLTFDGGVTKVITIDDLLSIELSDGTRYTPLTNTSTASAPIELLNPNETFVDVMMVVPTTSSAITLSDVILNNHYWGDDDGDGQGVDAATITPGSITLTITDKDNQTVNRADTLDVCKSPYKVVLSSPSGTLATQYGSPNSSSFVASTAMYYIKPNGSSICFVKPNMTYATGKYVGPTSMWNTTNGFIPQSTTPATYGGNFPTTGANGLYFDLAIGGESKTLSWNTITVGDITATPSEITSTSVRYTLTGPAVTSAQQISTNPGNVIKPTLPAIFELIGTGGDTTVKYGFELKKWFINRGDNAGILSAQTSWCANTGYRIVRVNDITNAAGVTSSGGVSIIGASPSSSGNYYQRIINAGLFSEWGVMNTFSGAGFSKYEYWTSDASDSYIMYVSPNDGAVRSSSNSSVNARGLCTF